jgi:hypothetical protein
MLSAIMKAETGVTAAVFLSIRNSRAQREALTAAAQIGLKDRSRELEMFSAIAIVYQSLDGQRADLAHGIWALSEELPDSVLWVDSKDFTRRNVENWGDIAKMSPLGGVVGKKGLDDQMQEDLFVYRQEDISALRDEIKDFWMAAFIFTAYLRLPTSEIGEQQFQKLYSVPPIQRALSRLREG